MPLPVPLVSLVSLVSFAPSHVHPCPWTCVGRSVRTTKLTNARRTPNTIGPFIAMCVCVRVCMCGSLDGGGGSACPLWRSTCAPRRANVRTWPAPLRHARRSSADTRVSAHRQHTASTPHPHHVRRVTSPTMPPLQRPGACRLRVLMCNRCLLACDARYGPRVTIALALNDNASKACERHALELTMLPGTHSLTTQ